MDVLQTITKICAAALLSSLIIGCDTVDRLSDSTTPPADETVSELALLGVTLGRSSIRELPTSEEVNARVETSPMGERYVVFIGIDFLFSPSERALIVGDINLSSAQSGRHFPYQYIFTDRSSGVRDVIPWNENEETDFQSIDYVGKVRFERTAEELTFDGDHYLSGLTDGVPARATNVELWFRGEENDAPDLVVDVELNQLILWRDIVSPLL